MAMATSRILTHVFSLALGCAMLWCFPTRLAAQEENSSKSLPKGQSELSPAGDDRQEDVPLEEQDTKSLVRKAFETTKAAKTLEEFESMIELCKLLLDREISESQQNYVKKLKAWNHNKRGEILAKKAAVKAEDSDAEEASRLDDEAMKEFSIALELDEKRWKSYHNRGVSYALLGKYDEALRDFDKTIELNPQYANTWFNRAEIYYEMGNYNRAIRQYDEVVRLKPGDAGAYSGRAHCHYQRRRFRQALNDYNQAVSLDAGNAAVYADRADAHAHLDQWDRAAQDYRQAITLDYSSARALLGAAWLMATCPDPRFRDDKRALQAAEKALTLGADQDYRYLDTLAAAQAANGDYDGAIESIEKALQLAEETLAEEELKKLAGRLELYKQQQPYREALRGRRITR